MGKEVEPQNGSADESEMEEKDITIMPARKIEAIGSIKNKDIRRREYAKVKKAKTKVCMLFVVVFWKSFIM